MAGEAYDVIVVGAGFGGSSCAALLAKRGLKVLLVEKNARAGGKAMTLSKRGFTHTAWVVISAPSQGNVLEVVLKELGMEGKVELIVPGVQGSKYKQSSGQYVVSPQDPVPDPNKIFDWLEVKQEDREEALKLLTELTMMSPQDVNALDDISLGEWLSRYKIPKGLYVFLTALVSDACFVLPADAVAASEAISTIQQIFLRGGGVFCKGGFSQLADTYARAVDLNGGKVMMRTRVKKITVEQGKVTGVITDRGKFLQAPIVISNAGIQPTVLKLVGEEHFDKSYVNYVKDLIPSLGFTGARYFLNKKVIADPYGAVFSDKTAWSLDKWIKAKSGDIPKEMTIWYEVPSNYDPDAAPPGKQIVLTGFLCPPDPQMTDKEKKKWWDRGDEIMFKVFPELPAHIESKEYYSTRNVSTLTRDQVLPYQGGECIGLAQIVGQCGRHKPSPKAPVQGLFYVGCDAGGRGVGTQQATDSGINVANMVFQYHQVRQAAR
jgi:phytoene dehydrogenase-like protein